MLKFINEKNIFIIKMTAAWDDKKCLHRGGKIRIGQ